MSNDVSKCLRTTLYIDVHDILSRIDTPEALSKFYLDPELFNVPATPEHK